MKNIHLYNIDQNLWENFALSNPTKPLNVEGGMVTAEGHGHIGRFEDDAHAKQVLEAAGYVDKGEGFFIPKGALT